MSSELLAYQLAYASMLVLVDSVFVYSSYLALSVWKGLAVSVYKGRAFWTALLAILVVVAFSYAGVLHIRFPHASTSLSQPQASSLATGAEADVVFTALALAAYAWVDRTMATMIRLDYLRRDILGWRRLRPFYWAGIAVGFGAYYYVVDGLPPSTGISYSTLILETAYVLVLVPMFYAWSPSW